MVQQGITAIINSLEKKDGPYEPYEPYEPKSNDKTVITISHRLSTVEKADLIIVLENGHIVEKGVHKDLVQQKGHYYTLFERQLKT